MSQDIDILDWIDDVYKEKVKVEKKVEDVVEDKQSFRFFNIGKFIDNLKNESVKSKFDRFMFSDNINAYDVAHNCINQVLYRLYNTPVPSYEDIWLPVYMRTIIGSSIHKFIQDYYPFDETEVAVKIDSLKFSGRIDAINGNNVLIEIKTVPYKDFEKILKTNTPRIKDIKQVLIYKRLLEKHIDDIRITQKNNTEKKYNWPKHDKYNIKFLQFIYVVHDLISADTSSIDEAVLLQKQIKKQMKSFKNKFYFVKDIIVNLSTDREYYEKLENEVYDKLHNILNAYHINKIFNSKSDNKYIDQTQCYFCLYNYICPMGSKK